MECNSEQSCELITFLQTSSPLGAAAQPVCVEQRSEQIRHRPPAAAWWEGCVPGTVRPEPSAACWRASSSPSVYSAEKWGENTCKDLAHSRCAAAGCGRGPPLAAVVHLLEERGSRPSMKWLLHCVLRPRGDAPVLKWFQTKLQVPRWKEA